MQLLTYLVVQIKLHIFFYVLVETLFVIVIELECEFSPKHHKHMQQQTAQSRVQHGDGMRLAPNAPLIPPY